MYPTFIFYWFSPDIQPSLYFCCTYIPKCTKSYKTWSCNINEVLVTQYSSNCRCKDVSLKVPPQRRVFLVPKCSSVHLFFPRVCNNSPLFQYILYFLKIQHPACKIKTEVKRPAFVMMLQNRGIRHRFAFSSVHSFKSICIQKLYILFLSLFIYLFNW